MKNTTLDSLKKYFNETSKEQIEKDWAETAKYDGVGERAVDFIERHKKLHNEM